MQNRTEIIFANCTPLLVVEIHRHQYIGVGLSVWLIVCHLFSMQSLFRWEVDLYTRSSSGGDAAADGHESAADTFDENCDSVTGHVPKTHRICHEHNATAYHQTGECYHFTGIFCTCENVSVLDKLAVHHCCILLLLTLVAIYIVAI